MELECVSLDKLWNTLSSGLMTMRKMDYCEQELNKLIKDLAINDH